MELQDNCHCPHHHMDYYCSVQHCRDNDRDLQSPRRNSLQCYQLLPSILQLYCSPCLFCGIHYDNCCIWTHCLGGTQEPIPNQRRRVSNAADESQEGHVNNKDDGNGCWCLLCSLLSLLYHHSDSFCDITSMASGTLQCDHSYL